MNTKSDYFEYKGDSDQRQEGHSPERTPRIMGGPSLRTLLTRLPRSVPEMKQAAQATSKAICKQVETFAGGGARAV